MRHDAAGLYTKKHRRISVGAQLRAGATVNVRNRIGGLLVAGFVLAMAACSSGVESQTVTVGPEREDCYGPFLKKCLVVNGGLFYSEIEGF